ncbi:MAG: tyrosine--tRNA ligase [Bacteroidales bacterium]
MATDFFSELEWRGLVVECTEGVRDLLAREKVTAYIGFDPTAPSLHVGSLLVIMALARLQRFGHHAIAIAGGGTGMIGDPSGKTQERQLLGLAQIEENLRGIRTQLAHFLDFDVADNPARIVNNADWLASLNLIEFLRDTGKYFTVNYMLAKESVKRRIEQEDGISYTEFTYLMLQAYDFLTLYDRYGCKLQMGGSDQWGNITAGCELIRRVRGGQAHGLVMPLVTTATGVKFGKTEAGTIWLDPERTPPYEFYQFWINTDDRDAVAYLKYFTFLERDAIEALEDEMRAAPEKRGAQRALAAEVTRLVHGEAALADAQEKTARLFGPATAGTAADIVRDLEPSAEIEVEDDAIPLSRILAHPGVGLAASGGEATRLIKAGGVYLNGERVADERRRVTAGDTLFDGRILVQKGQRQKLVVRLTFAK